MHKNRAKKAENFIGGGANEWKVLTWQIDKKTEQVYNNFNR